MVKVNVGDRVEILAGDERGSWGIVKMIIGDEYHVAHAGAEVAARVYTRSEIRKSRKVTR